MLTRFVDWLVDKFFASPKYRLIIQTSIFLVVISPIVVMSYVGYKDTEEHLTELTLSRRESLAHLASIVLKEKFDRIVDLGVSFATRVQFRKHIEAGRWDEAIKILESAPKDFPYIDTVGLFDPKGTLMAVTPPIPEAIGQNFAYRDYYQGVSKDWQPYVSEVFKRAPEPKYNVVSIAVPIKSESIREGDRKILGILLLTINLDIILDWAREIEVGPGGFAYFVDRNGHVAGHPKFSSQDEVVDFSEVPAVKKILQGEKGVEILYNPIEKEERISAYEQVPVYGWGVIVQQPTLTAFASRKERLQQLLTFDAITIAAVSFLAYLILGFIKTQYRYRYQEKVLFESIGDGLVAIDRHWNIIRWNKAASSLSGWSQEEALGKPFREILKFIREKDKSENIVFIEETMLYGKPHLMENDTKLVRKDGTEIYVGDSAAPVFDDRGRVDGAIIIFRDISKEHELQSAKEEFSSLAAHQLRAPVTVIKGYTSMLVDEGAGKNERWKEYLQQMQTAVDKLNDLVSALLNASRLELGTLAINPEPAYLPDIADGIIESMLPQIKEKKLTLEKNYAKDVPSLNIDIKLMQAIFQNLLSNAIKYTPEGGKISVGVEKKEHDLLIKVGDSGYGIPKSEQSKVFSKFFRATNTAEQVPEGTGLGLYIVKSAVEQGGGKIWFESEENKGTSFYISFPLEGMKKKEGTKGLS